MFNWYFDKCYRRKWFLLGSNLGDGGTVGISLALKYAFGFSPAIITLLINVVLIIIGWKFLSKKVAIYTVISNAALSLFLGLTKDINLGIDDLSLTRYLVEQLLVSAWVLYYQRGVQWEDLLLLLEY